MLSVVISLSEVQFSQPVFSSASATQFVGSSSANLQILTSFRDIQSDFLDFTPPQLATPVRAEAAILSDLPGLVVVNLNDVDLNESQAANPINYRLEQLNSAGDPVARLQIDPPNYDRYADRILLSGFGRLQPGDYRLTIFSEPDPLVPGSTGISSQAEIFFDGDGDGLPGGLLTADFSVKQASGEPVANPAIFSGNLRALDAFLEELTSDTDAAESALASENVAQQLLGLLQQTIETNPDGGSEALAKVVNSRLEELFRAEWEAEYNLLDVTPSEFVIVWSNGAEFLLQNPEGIALPGQSVDRVGVDGSGALIQEIDGSVVVQGARGQVLAILPVDVAGRLLSESDFLENADELNSAPDLRFHLQFSSLAEQNQIGILYFNSEGEAKTQQILDTRAEIGVRTIDLSDHLSGLDTQQEDLNAFFLNQLRQVVGQNTEPLLALWLDPVDYVLEDLSGNTSQHAGGISIDSFPGSFYGQGGVSEILIVPGITDGQFTLELVGVGAGFRGGANLLLGAAQGNTIQSIPLSGQLSFGDSLIVEIDFGLRSPAPTVFASTFIGPFPERTSSGPSIFSIRSLLLTAATALPLFGETFSGESTRDLGGGGSKENEDEDADWLEMLEELLDGFQNWLQVLPEGSEGPEGIEPFLLEKKNDDDSESSDEDEDYDEKNSDKTSNGQIAPDELPVIQSSNQEQRFELGDSQKKPADAAPSDADHSDREVTRTAEPEANESAVDRLMAEDDFNIASLSAAILLSRQSPRSRREDQKRKK